jgi:hypothetical protein
MAFGKVNISTSLAAPGCEGPKDLLGGQTEEKLRDYQRERRHQNQNLRTGALCSESVGIGRWVSHLVCVSIGILLMELRQVVVVPNKSREFWIRD